MNAERKPSRRIRGIVKSDKMEKTITVSVERNVKHPRYGKYVTRATTMMAHDAHNDAREGDLVEIEQTRPLSKNKCWRLVRILRRAPGGAIETPAVDEEPAAQVS
jgi:small subunit ribosomal protein S17